ncbi:MAG: thioredoxin family protein [Bacteroidales bacterium]|nr:thioredoxin family protein [Bacteroidales bacterium]
MNNKLKNILLTTFLLVVTLSAVAQDPVTIYNPSANAKADLATATQQAKEQQKNVLVQVGGNWCPWCIRLHGFFTSDAKADSILTRDFVYVLVNYSKENKNPEVLASLGYPQRFGFPVLLVLDENGQRLHTQDTGLLERDKGYDPEKVSRFLLNWNTTALKPETYR